MSGEKKDEFTEPKVFHLLVKDLCRDIYDLYAEYEDEEEEDQFPVPPCLLLSPTKHLALNLNVGGTVSLVILCHKQFLGTTFFLEVGGVESIILKLYTRFLFFFSLIHSFACSLL